jgi:hypothetical protein
LRSMNTHKVRPTSRSLGEELMAVGLLMSALSASAPASWAQISGGGGARHRAQQSQQQTAPQPPPLPNLREVWPRLDSGAVLCETRDDLTSYQARLAGGSNYRAGVAPKCRMIQDPIGITILEREGLSQTKVMLAGAAKETGWTNVYLPTTAPPPPMTSAQTR